MSHAPIGGIKLYYEDVGRGLPLIFVHEFAGDYRSWRPQVRFFSRRYRTIAFNARGYPPSEVPEDPTAYSQDRAADDIREILDYLGIDRAHVCGLSMGGYATVHFGLKYPERARSLTVAGAGYGSIASERERFKRDSAEVVERLESEGMAQTAETYMRGPARVQFIEKDPVGWQESYEQFAMGSARGHALTLRGVQMMRPSIFELGDRLARLRVPTLIVTGDEDDPCLEPAIFMKRTIPTAGLLVIPKSGHAINQEEPETFNRALLDFLTLVDLGRWTTRSRETQTGSAILPGPATHA